MVTASAGVLGTDDQGGGLVGRPSVDRRAAGGRAARRDVLERLGREDAGVGRLVGGVGEERAAGGGAAGRRPRAARWRARSRTADDEVVVGGQVAERHRHPRPTGGARDRVGVDVAGAGDVAGDDRVVADGAGSAGGVGRRVVGVVDDDGRAARCGCRLDAVLTATVAESGPRTAPGSPLKVRTTRTTTTTAGCRRRRPARCHTSAVISLGASAPRAPRGVAAGGDARATGSQACAGGQRHRDLQPAACPQSRSNRRDRAAAACCNAHRRRRAAAKGARS